VKHLIREMSAYISQEHPEAIFTFKESGNIFDLLFTETQPPLLAKLITTEDFGPDYLPRLQYQLGKIEDAFPDVTFAPVALQDQMVLTYKPEMFILYNIDKQQVVNAIKNAFRENEIMIMTSGSIFVPVVIGTEMKSIEDVIANLAVKNRKGKDIRLGDFISIRRTEGLKYIHAGMEGEYYPLAFRIDKNEIQPTMAKLRALLHDGDTFEASFSGSYFSNQQMIKDLFLILSVSLFLLYFILAAQFESIVLPVIVLSEVIIDIFGALLLLYIFGSSLNLMSLIGIVVMSGIIINDSILKIDTINQLYHSGTPLLKALIVGGHRRLKPILMTSITTILALLPFFFFKGMGSDIQKPLALSIIGGMLVGTLASLFFIPLGYYYLMRIRRPSAKSENS
jgi:multidrug efflux pump subunit AcrB